MGPMGQIGMPQQMLAQGVGAPGGGAGPTIPPQMMPPPGPGIGMGGGMQGLAQDPRIMAYIQALRQGGGGLSGAMPGG